MSVVGYLILIGVAEIQFFELVKLSLPFYLLFILWCIPVLDGRAAGEQESAINLFRGLPRRISATLPRTARWP